MKCSDKPTRNFPREAVRKSTETRRRVRCRDPRFSTEVTYFSFVECWLIVESLNLIIELLCLPCAGSCSTTSPFNRDQSCYKSSNMFAGATSCSPAAMSAIKSRDKTPDGETMRGNKSVGGRGRRGDLSGAKVRPDEKGRLAKVAFLLRRNFPTVPLDLCSFFLLPSPFHPPVLSSCFLIFAPFSFF